MAKTFEGYVIMEEIIKEGESKSIKPIGVALEKCKAQQIIADDSAFYAENPFEYDRVSVGNILVYTSNDNKFKDKYTIQKCLIVTDI